MNSFNWLLCAVCSQTYYHSSPALFYVIENYVFQASGKVWPMKGIDGRLGGWMLEKNHSMSSPLSVLGNISSSICDSFISSTGPAPATQYSLHGFSSTWHFCLTFSFDWWPQELDSHRQSLNPFFLPLALGVVVASCCINICLASQLMFGFSKFHHLSSLH